MKTRYEVIWIDDEWEKMDAFKEECEVIHHIHLHPFRTQKAGMDEFDKNPKKWDAIILDAKMLDESENEIPMLVGLRKAVQHINEKALLRKVPYFISTGQPDLMSNETFEQSFGVYYIKERDDAKLIEDIKKAANESGRFRVKSYYCDAIEQLRLINDWGCEKILDIFEAMHLPNKEIDPLLYYNPLRQVLESVFISANKFKLIPDELVNGQVNINQCVQYLSGRNADVVGIRYGRKQDSIVSPHIKDLMFQILNLGNVNSHSTILGDKDLKKLKSYIDSNVCNSKYLIFSLALQVCEIVLYISKCVKNHQDISENTKMCKTIGTVELIDDNLTHCIVKSKRKSYETKFVLLKSYVERKNLIGKKVVVVDYQDNTDKDTKQKYPYFAKVEPLD